MSTPEPTGGPARPARIAGIVLLAVAAIALVMGVISLLPSSGGGNQAGGTSTTPPPATTTTSKPAATTTTTSTAPTTTTSKPAVTTTTSAAQPPPGGGNPQSEPVRVYNNGTIPHLAEQAANDFRSAGYTVPTVGNYSQGIIATTTVYFRPGTAEEAEANAMAQAFHMRSMPRFDGIQSADPGVIVIITNDYSPPKKG